ncbi:hypothetical protein [Mycobacterium sp.]|uniref:hypothetical protein n=1 Tax=Mycobacterium sp. TaxID=1785 RepID=UPI003BA860A0
MQGGHAFVDELVRFAAVTADQQVHAIARRAAAPLRVAVHGRCGAGRRTVARALARAGVWSDIAVAPPPASARTGRIGCTGHEDVDLNVYVIVEVVKPEDREAVAALKAARRPVLAVLNKVDLAGPLSGRTGRLPNEGPVAAAQARCAHYSALVGVPMVPMIALLAVAGFDNFDDRLWAALRALAAGLGGAAVLEGSFDGFLGADLPVTPDERLRLLNSLDLFGIALGVAALRRGCTMAQARTIFRRVSGVDAVIDEVAAGSAVARYRRVLAAAADLEALAVSHAKVSAPISEFLRCDDTVIARMAAALDVAEAVGLEASLPDDSAELLARAVRWQRRGRDNSLTSSCRVSDARRTCCEDIARGSLRLWGRARGTRGCADSEVSGASR